MMQRFSGHRVLCDGVFRPATLTVEGGQIVAIDDTVASGPGVVEAGEHALIPGLIELHTDNHEKYFEPRPGGALAGNAGTACPRCPYGVCWDHNGV